MIEQKLRKPYDAFLVEPILKFPFLKKLHPNVFTFGALITGVCTLPLLISQHPYWALLFLILSGYLDTLDGAQARLTRTTSDLGTFLDVFFDRIVEFCVVLGFFFVAPKERGAPCIFMLGSIFLCVTAFLMIGVLADNSTKKRFYYSPGLIERAEAFFFFALLMLIPSAFTPLAYLFSGLVFLTAFFHLYRYVKSSY